MKAPRLGGAILVLFSTVLTLAAGEVALIVLDQYAPPAYPPETRRADLYEFHEAYGYRLHPNLATTYDYPLENPRTLGLVANSEGFRDDRELGEPDPRPRIQVIGDSFVFGEGVEADERFTDVLENLVPGWRVDNLGMTGYGPGLMLRAFESVGRETEPEIVILCMYTDDFRRVRPYYAGWGLRFPVSSGAATASSPYPIRGPGVGSGYAYGRASASCVGI